MKLPDLLEQVNDGIFAMDVLKKQDHADSARIGATGAVYFSEGLMNSATWRRETSNGELEKGGRDRRRV